MVLEHLFPFGIVEGLVTMLLLKYFLKHEPELVYAVLDPSTNK
jgi:cobalt/nickel transport system permease protein